MTNFVLSWLLIFIFSFNAIDNYLVVTDSDLFVKCDIANEQFDDSMTDSEHLHVHHVDYLYTNEKTNRNFLLQTSDYLSDNRNTSKLLFTYSKIWQPPEII